MISTESLLDAATAAANTSIDHAEQLYREIMERADGETWGTAGVELIDLLHGGGYCEEAVVIARQILDADDLLVTPRSRARAGVHLALSSEPIGVPLAPLIEVLARSVRACFELGEHEWGAIGIAQLGHFLMIEGRLDDARPVLIEAAAILERLDGKSRAASTLRRLATLEQRQGNPELAIAHLEHAIEVMDRHPFGHAPGHRMGKQRAGLAAELAALRDQGPKTPS